MVLESSEQAYLRLSRMISELNHYAFVSKNTLNNWHFSRGCVAKQTEQNSVEIGFCWSPEPFPVYFSKRFRFDHLEKHQRLFFRGDFGGESLVIVDGRSFGELNEEHHYIDVSCLCDSQEHELIVEVVPRSLFGKPVEYPVFRESRLFLIDKDIYDVLLDMKQVLELIRWSGDQGLSNRLIRLLDNTISMIDIPRDTDSYRSSVVDDAVMYSAVSGVWAPPVLNYEHTVGLPEESKANLLRAGVELWKGLSGIRDLYPKKGSMTVFGHAHIDYAWLWPVEETKRKIRRTFANALRLSKRFRDFVFVQSSAKMYEDLHEIDPFLFEQVSELVREGRWEPIGGSWVEFDANIPGPESLIRQFLMGQKSLNRFFSKRSRVAWLPDAFGFSWILPQILRSAGIDFFVTTKLTWNDTNPFPYDLCRWRGIDGSEVIYHSFNNPNEGYNGHLDVRDVMQTWQNYRSKDLHMETILSNGYGDGGGGPTDEMLEQYLRMKDLPFLPVLKMRKVEEFFNSLEKGAHDLPVWDGELYLEKHRGTASSQSRTKILHKRAEDALYLTEYLATILCNENKYPHDNLHDCWDMLLRNEFHDILPGSSIREVYVKTEQELNQLLDQTDRMQQDMLESLGDSRDYYLTVINVSSAPETLCFIMDGREFYEVTTAEGILFERQMLSDGRVLYMSEETLAPFEKKSFRRTYDIPVHPLKRENVDDTTMENDHLRVKVNPDGSMFLFDKDTGREVFEGSGNQLFLFKDIPPYWDAWDISIAHEKHGKRLIPENVAKVEWGPLREAIRVTYKLDGSSILQTYTLARESRRVDVETTIDWHMRRTMLKAEFPLRILSRSASFDLGCGYIQRSTHCNRTTDQAMFEVPGHRWVDMSEFGFGTSILNNGLYGHSVRQNKISLTLLRSPIFPDFLSDEGENTFTYSVFPHPGNSLLPVLQESEKLNRPPVVIEGEIKELSERIIDFRGASETLKLMSMKRNNEGEVVIRLCETLGKRGKTSVSFGFAFSKAFLCNVLEEPLTELTPANGRVDICYRPFEIITLVLRADK